MGYILKSSLPLLLAFFLLMPCAVQEFAVTATTGAVQGTVSVAGANDPLLLEDAKIVIYGDTTMSSTESNSEGSFSFRMLRPGTYLIEADYYGLHTERRITIHPGEIVHISLELQEPGPRAKL